MIQEAIIPDIKGRKSKGRPVGRPIRFTGAQVRRAQRAMAEIVRRKTETLNLYQPIPTAQKFHQTDSYWRLVTGGNRSGKSASGAAEVSWLVTGTHPWIKYPKRNLVVYCIAHRLKELKEVMWPKLGHPGQIKIIRDEHTRQWRPVLPDNPYDAAYQEAWRDAPPFLPERFIKGGLKACGWYSRKDDIPEQIPLTIGGKICFFSSEGKPVKGSSIDFAWFDEEIDKSLWIPEMEARCLDRKGRLIWTFTPEIATEMGLVMHQRANDPSERFEIREFNMLIKDNPYISEEKKQRFRAGLRTQREIDTKWFGKYALEGSAVYPEYSEQVHHIDPFTVPDEWSRWMIVDPGVQVCAVLFGAKPPSWQRIDARDGRLLGKHENCEAAASIAHEFHVFDELYIQRCSASEFGKQVKAKMGRFAPGGFEGFIIDGHYARMTQVGSGKTIGEHYSDALESNGIWSQFTDSGFIDGSHDVKGREESLRSWLELHPVTARPTLVVHHGKAPNLDWEMPQQRYKTKQVNGVPVITDERVAKNDHLVACAEYAADYGPEWTQPKRTSREDNAFQRKIRELQLSQMSDKYISVGPS